MPVYKLKTRVDNETLIRPLEPHKQVLAFEFSRNLYQAGHYVAEGGKRKRKFLQIVAGNSGQAL